MSKTSFVVVVVVAFFAACPAPSSHGEGEGEGAAGEGEGAAGEGEGEGAVGEGEGAVSQGEGEGEGEGTAGEGEGEGSPAVCGDGVRTVGEECDDGNTTDGDGCDSTCHVEAPGGQSDAQVSAFHAINAIRARVGLPGAHLNAHLDQSAQAHADYFANNANAYAGGLSPHNEDPNFANGFTGASFADREGAAGYNDGFPLFEVMAFEDDPNGSVDEWFNTVLHRIPLVHPNMIDFGYGGSNANGRSVDVVDFGGGASADSSQVVVVPAPGAVNVQSSFFGNEGPQPPPPPSGAFPSGPIVSVLVDMQSSFTVTRHDIVDSTGAVLPVTFVDSTSSVGAFLQNSVAFYADGPATSGETLHVFVEGTVNGAPFAKDWTFTVQ